MKGKDSDTKPADSFGQVGARAQEKPSARMNLESLQLGSFDPRRPFVQHTGQVRIQLGCSLAFQKLGPKYPYLIGNYILDCLRLLFYI